jgi:L-fucose mutarotase/ribose pyranase (RbsD/FucU family)
LQVSRLIDDIVRTDIVEEINEPGDIPMKNEDDRKFYDVAKAAFAFLITGNICGW